MFGQKKSQFKNAVLALGKIVLHKPNSGLEREVGNIRILTVLILRAKEYSGTFASVWERPKKFTCLSVFVTSYSVVLELGTQKKTNLEKMTI